MTPEVHAFYDEPTGTITYVVFDPGTRDAVVIDPVMDFDLQRVSVATTSVERLESFVRERGLRVHYVIDTHAHADHLTGQGALARRLGTKTAISGRIGIVQGVFKELLALGDDFPTDGRQWDLLLEDGREVLAGSLPIVPLATPGHTPACTTLWIGDALFTGDTLFMPDFGTGRCDFPGGDAGQLYDSIQRLYEFPADTRVFVGHDYGTDERGPAWETTIGASRERNVHVRAGTSRDEFVRWRTERDATLLPPKLIFPSLQVNVAAGELPAPDARGRRFFKLPIGLFD